MTMMLGLRLYWHSRYMCMRAIPAVYCNSNSVAVAKLSSACATIALREREVEGMYIHIYNKLCF